jgi:8-amino-7-oxononanoate synthase
MMPFKDGFEICKTLKTDERTSHIPIVLLTAKADIDSKLQGLEHGADAYLMKPFNKEELLLRIKKLLELRQQLQQYYLSKVGLNAVYMAHPDKLGTEGGKKYVAVESIYSMDGDIAPLSEIAKICRENNAALIVDEAHGTGVLGEKGEGLVNDLGLESLVWARVHTFGKALGVHGAAVVGSRLLRDFLINHARSFIYTTALPPLAYHHIHTAYQLLPFADRHQLTALIAYFIQKTSTLTLSEGHFVCNPSSPIQGIVIPNNQKIVQLAQRLYDNGIYAKAILSPTVPRGMERIRICLHSFNTFEEIDKLMEVIL